MIETALITERDRDMISSRSRESPLIKRVLRREFPEVAESALDDALRAAWQDAYPDETRDQIMERALVYLGG